MILKMKKIAIIGSGSWGVALAIHLAKSGHKIKIWSFSSEEADLINNEKKCKFLPQAVIPENVECSTSYEEVLKEAELILQVTPSKFTRNIVKQYKQYINPEKQPIVICSKGIEAETALTLDDVIIQEIPNARIGALSGPSHAEEVSIAVPTVLVIASKDEELKKLVQDTFMNKYMRIYTSNDVKGVELGGALKNIIAFCAGVAAGIGLGDNAFAALITRGLVEIRKLGIAMGGREETFYGLSGLGDLIVTCLSEHSRNRRAGKLIGQGKTLEETKQEVGMTIESIDNIQIAKKMSDKLDIELPILNTVYNILYHNLDPKKGVDDLMTRQKKEED